MWGGLTYLGRTRKISNQGAYVAYSDPYRNVQPQLVYKTISRYSKLLHSHMSRRLTAATLVPFYMRLMPQEPECVVRNVSEKANIDMAPLISFVIVASMHVALYHTVKGGFPHIVHLFDCSHPCVVHGPSSILGAM